MFQDSEVLKKKYHDCWDQFSRFDILSIKKKLGVECHNGQLSARFLNKDYLISENGITDHHGNLPRCMIRMILAKYLLMCPDTLPQEIRYGASFKDFKESASFANVDTSGSDTAQGIIQHFSGRLDDLVTASESLGGYKFEADLPYDLAIRFDVLPRISLLLLYNVSDEEFPANCMILFQKHAGLFLDPETLLMTSAFFAKRLKKVDRSFQKPKLKGNIYL